MYSGDEEYGDEITSGVFQEDMILLECPQCGETEEAPLDFIENGGRRRCPDCWQVMLPVESSD